MIKFVLDHPLVILYLAAGWFIAAIISAMPPIPENSNFFVRWAYNVAQIVGASLDKVGHAAQQSTAYKQVIQTLETSDPNGLVKTAKTTQETATTATGAAQ